MSNLSQKIILFHKDRVLLFNQTILIDSSLFNVDKSVRRKLNFNSIDLVEVTSIEESPVFLLENSQWVTTREVLQVINPQEFSMFARGLSLIQWDKYHRFCGQCAKETILTNQAFERQCEDCQINYYPRISPAIIVLIHRDDEILMARSAHFPPGVYALIAGFVEAGETLEEAIHREVLEEVGINIKNLSYYGSQPWPFPDSLMIGFIAEYESGEVLIDKNELEDAGWYRYNQLPGLPSFPMSIAFKMIHQFKSRYADAI